MRRILLPLAFACAVSGCSRDGLPDGLADGGGGSPDLVAAPLDLTLPVDFAQPPGDLAVACLPGPATVDGTLPDGTALKARYAWVGYSGAECSLTASVLLTVDATPPASLWDASGIRFDLSLPAAGQQMVMVTHQKTSVVGYVVVDQADPPPWQGGPPMPRVRGFLKVGDGGLALAGSFDAGWCPPIDAICI